MRDDFYNDDFDINWADKTNSEPLTLDKLLDDRFVLIQANIADCFEHSSEDYKLDVNSADGGKNAIGNRLERAKEHFMSKEPMDYPIVEFNFITEEVSFTNGRHRSLAASHMGCEYIPMLVYKDSLDYFKSVVRTKGMDEPLEKAKYVDDSAHKLKINWANAQNSTDEIKHIFEEDSHVLLQVNIEKAFSELDDKTEEDLYFKPGRDKDFAKEVETIKEHMLNESFVDFPSMESNKEWDSMNLTSGKAIAVAAYDLGCKYVPTLVSKKDLSHFQSIVETKTMDERLDSPTLETENKLESSRKNKIF